MNHRPHHPQPEVAGAAITPTQAVNWLVWKLNGAELRHAASQAFAGMMSEAYDALFEHGVDFRQLPAYGAADSPFSPATPARHETAALKATLRWVGRMRREIRAEVHRHEVGVAVLVPPPSGAIPVLCM